jgi:hypothetical protein
VAAIDSLEVLAVTVVEVVHIFSFQIVVLLLVLVNIMPELKALMLFGVIDFVMAEVMRWEQLLLHGDLFDFYSTA